MSQATDQARAAAQAASAASGQNDQQFRMELARCLSHIAEALAGLEAQLAQRDARR